MLLQILPCKLYPEKEGNSNILRNLVSTRTVHMSRCPELRIFFVSCCQWFPRTHLRINDNPSEHLLLITMDKVKNTILAELEPCSITWPISMQAGISDLLRLAYISHSLWVQSDAAFCYAFCCFRSVTCMTSTEFHTSITFWFTFHSSQV